MWQWQPAHLPAARPSVQLSPLFTASAPSRLLPRQQVHQTLTTNGLRERVALRADGGMRTGRDILVTAALGADEYGFGTVVRCMVGSVQCSLP